MLELNCGLNIVFQMSFLGRKVDFFQFFPLRIRFNATSQLENRCVLSKSTFNCNFKRKGMWGWSQLNNRKDKRTSSAHKQKGAKPLLDSEAVIISQLPASEKLCSL